MCPICHEHHDETRSLSFDGFGINSCGKYRERLATFTDAGKAAAHLGPIFAAGPEMLEALMSAAIWIDQNRDDEAAGEGQQAKWILDWLHDVIAKAKGE
jgi:hypothetical protein